MTIRLNRRARIASALTMCLAPLSLVSAQQTDQFRTLDRSGLRRKPLEDKPMTTGELDKETYRRIIQDYFRAFGTGDFSNVKFSFRHPVSQPIQLFSCLYVDDCPPGDATSRAST